MTLDEQAAQVMAKLADLEVKYQRIRQLMSIILQKMVFEGHVMEWPADIEQECWDLYLIAKTELQQLTSELP